MHKETLILKHIKIVQASNINDEQEHLIHLFYMLRHQNNYT